MNSENYYNQSTPKPNQLVQNNSMLRASAAVGDNSNNATFQESMDIHKSAQPTSVVYGTQMHSFHPNNPSQGTSLAVPQGSQIPPTSAITVPVQTINSANPGGYSGGMFSHQGISSHQQTNVHQQDSSGMNYRHTPHIYPLQQQQQQQQQLNQNNAIIQKRQNYPTGHTSPLQSHPLNQIQYSQSTQPKSQSYNNTNQSQINGQVSGYPTMPLVNNSISTSQQQPYSQSIKHSQAPLNSNSYGIKSQQQSSNISNPPQTVVPQLVTSSLPTPSGQNSHPQYLPSSKTSPHPLNSQPPHQTQQIRPNAVTHINSQGFYPNTPQALSNQSFSSTTSSSYPSNQQHGNTPKYNQSHNNQTFTKPQSVPSAMQSYNQPGQPGQGQNFSKTPIYPPQQIPPSSLPPSSSKPISQQHNVNPSSSQYVPQNQPSFTPPIVSLSHSQQHQSQQQQQQSSQQLTQNPSTQTLKPNQTQGFNVSLNVPQQPNQVQQKQQIPQQQHQQQQVQQKSIPPPASPTPSSVSQVHENQSQQSQIAQSYAPPRSVNAPDQLVNGQLAGGIPKHEQEKYDCQLKANVILSDEERWYRLDHEEIYQLKQESLKKSFNKIVQKLQQERHFSEKRRCPFEDILGNTEKKQKKDTQTLKSDFTNLKEAFGISRSLETLENRKMQKQRENVNRATSEIKSLNAKQVKDIDIYRLHYIDFLKRKQLFTSSATLSTQSQLKQSTPFQNSSSVNQNSSNSQNISPISQNIVNQLILSTNESNIPPRQQVHDPLHSINQPPTNINISQQNQTRQSLQTPQQSQYVPQQISSRQFNSSISSFQQNSSSSSQNMSHNQGQTGQSVSQIANTQLISNFGNNQTQHVPIQLHQMLPQPINTQTQNEVPITNQRNQNQIIPQPPNY